MIQNIIVIAILAAAAFYLGKQFYDKFFAKKSNCDSCAVSKMMTDK